jgi:hypothetical protein
MLSFAATRSSALSVLRAARSAPLLRTSRLFSAQPAPVAAASTPAPAKPKSFFERIWGFQSNTGSSKINRWLMFLPCVGVHICYGTPYAWYVSFRHDREPSIGIGMCSAFHCEPNHACTYSRPTAEGRICQTHISGFAFFCVSIWFLGPCCRVL